MPGGSRSVEGRLAKSAVGAVTDVEPDQLVTATAGTQVLRGPDQRRLGWGKGQGGRHDAHLLAGLAVHVDAVRAHLGHRLAARGRCPEAIGLLWILHRAGTISGTSGARSEEAQDGVRLPSAPARRP